jgi:hypothetical protein
MMIEVDALVKAPYEALEVATTFLSLFSSFSFS